MKSELTNFFKRLDFFGVEIKPYINRDESQFRSLIGDITTFMVFAASIAYSITVLYQWQMLQLTPKIQQSSYVSSNSDQLDINYDVVRFYFWNPDNNLIDPFQTNVIVPVAVYLDNYAQSRQVILNISEHSSNDGKKYIIPEVNLGFTLNENNLKRQKQMFILFQKCDQSLLPDGQLCATEEIVEQFYQQPLNTIMMQINYKTIDSKDKKVKNSIQELVIQIETQTCYTLNSYLQSTLFELNDSFLFGPSSFHEFIEGAFFQTQTNSIEYCQQAFGYEVYAIALIQLSANQSKYVYEYPHASDLLANIGSIISILFLLKYIVLIFNAQQLEELMEIELIKQYYPQFENIRIVKSWCGKIKNVYYGQYRFNSNQIKNLIQFKEMVSEQVKVKLSSINMLYEISRLYLIIRSMKPLKEIKKVHLLGIRFPSLNNELFTDPETTTRSTDLSSENLLTSADIGILSLDQKFQVRVKEYNVAEEMDQDFYDENMVL